MNSAIVIGSGILGSSTAYHLAKQGVQVTIVDREEEGQATKAAAGIICPWYAQRRNKAWYSLADQGAVYYRKLIDDLSTEGENVTGYKQVGMLGIHTDEEKLIRAKDRVLKRREDTPEIGDVELLSKEETIKKFPLLNDEYRSLYISGGARVNGYELNKALLNVAQKFGAKIITGDASLIYKNNKVSGVTVNGEEVLADKTIACTGAWMNELLQPLGINFNAHPQKAQIIHLNVPNSYTDDWPVIMPPNNQYILPNDNSKIIIGATHEKNAGFDRRLTAGGIHEVLTKAIDVAPALADATFSHVNVGFRPFTPDSIPVIGKLDGIEQFILATGLGASGLTTGPFVGKQLSLLALNESLSINLDLYQPNQAIKNNN